ncbi:hypothetical protein DOTSEDRAFT_118962 [Lecanosticta acicola]|uniref:GAR domain-containing protein n=1 Tax=Lecanosticta acicola TaxID=111012 RepID=A0AAI9EF79_9PEZI|nr:hypothetical protein DOTSEDRAFT_118962 [Lecanosticta acicola]
MDHPFANPPRLPSPIKGRINHHEPRHQHSRTVSRSPVRQHARDYNDPLLRHLSPTSTLRAFVTDSDTMSPSDALFASVRHSSVSERALGAKAAQTCLDLRNWTREMQSWEWSGTFDVPEPARRKTRVSTVTFTSMLSQNTIATAEDETEGSDGEEEYWGSLPACTVEMYEKRADEIGQQLDQIDVEELKEYVLVSHYRADSRASSRNGMVGERTPSAEIKRLDDFMALVTATILQALPYITQLNRLLDLWTTRLMVLRSAPRYLRDLKRARTDLDHGWASIAVSITSGPGQNHASFDRKTMLQMKAVIEQQVGSLGRRLDRFLNDLEGRDDTVPDAWIDDFESLETAYGSWVVQAERKVLENEWHARRASVGLPPAALPVASKRSVVGQPEHAVPMSELEDPILDHDAVMRASMDKAEYNDETAKQSASHVGDHVVDGSGRPLMGRNPKLDSLSNPALPPPGGEIVGERADSATAAAFISRGNTPASDSSSKEDGMGQVAKRRAAFLNGIEKTNSLNRSRGSPAVRPFEHASNAFTRLFKKDRSPEQLPIRRTASGRIVPIQSADGEPNQRELPTSVSANGTSSDSRGGELKSPQTGTNAEAKKEAGSVKKSQGSQHTIIRGESPIREYNVEGDPQIGDLGSNARRNTSLSSPFHSPGEELLPDNWPLRSTTPVPPTEKRCPRLEMHKAELSNSGSESGPETKAPSVALEADAFDRMFVQSLPSTPQSRPRSSRAAQPSMPWAGPQKRAASLPRTTPESLPEMPKLDIPAGYLDMLSASRSKTPPSRSRPAQTPSNETSPVAPRIGRADKSVPSDIARPTAGTPRSRGQSAAVAGRARSSSSPLATSPSPELEFEESEAPVGEADMDRQRMINRASTTSIEIFSRSQLKSIDVPRSSRHSVPSPRPTPPQTPRASSDTNNTLEGNDPMEFKGMLAFPTPPRRSSLSAPVSGHDTPTVLRGVPQAGPPTDATAESPAEGLKASAPAPLNAIMAKRRGKSALKIEDERSLRTTDPLLSQTNKHSRQTHAEDDIDKIDRHVSDVLDKLSGGIRFKPRPGAETPVPLNEPREYVGPRAKQSTVPRMSKGASMTIAPAEASPKRPTTSVEPEVRLYHLIQVGREEQPIKLFVRLVGENERVMVRVGGGWADLADFLRGYAEHHGSRTVSEGALDVQTMPHVHARKVSGPAEVRAKTPSTPTDVAARPGSKDSDEELPRSGPMRPRTRDGRITPVADWNTPSNAYHSTSKSSSTGSSRPGTANVSRPSSRQGMGEVGLAGPSSGRKASLPDHKAKWVEGMLERAKAATSAEKSKEDREKYFGELGKGGGTRRVVFRSSPGPSSSPGPDGKAR